MPWWLLILYIITFAVVSLVIYNLLNIFLLSKIKVNKWIVLGAALLVFFLPALLGANLQGKIIVPIQSGIFVILFLWFMELNGFGRRRVSNKDKIVIKPKAKPNRIKKIK